MKEALLWALIGILTTAVVFLTLFLWSYKRQLRSLMAQLQFIEEQDTNLCLSTRIPLRDITLLCVKINSVLQKHRQMELAMRRADRQLRQSITSISHDLRTPLTSMSGYLQLLSKEDLPAEKRARYLRVVEQRLASLGQKLEQLFLYARITSGELELAREPVHLNNLLRDCISAYYEECRQRFGEPVIRIPETPCVITGDAQAVTRILENLMNNSLAHGAGDFKIALIREPGWAHLLFSNRTDSVSPQDVPQLFERFYTTDHSRTKRTTGLGLSIARHLTRQLGGSIRAQLNSEHLEIHLLLPLREESL